jgi:hypothetical protein
VSCEGLLNPCGTSKPSKFRSYWILILDMKDVKLVKLVQGVLWIRVYRGQPAEQKPLTPTPKNNISMQYTFEH